MAEPRFPWNSNDVASCFPWEINKTTLNILPGTSSCIFRAVDVSFGFRNAPDLFRLAKLSGTRPG
jgi:hypothetical protein